MNAYQEVAEKVRVEFAAERENAVKRGAAQDRLAGIDAKIAESAVLVEHLADATDKASALDIVKDRRGTLPDDRTQASNGAITACMIVKTRLEAVA